jgi:hypothetical protein
MNFAEGGSSNDYITRTAISQCNVVKPDLLIAEFVHKNRSEGYRDGHAFQIGPWLWNNWYRRIGAAMRAPKGLKQEILKRQIAVNRFYHYYTDDFGFINTLKNVLLVQSFAKAIPIPYLLIWSEHEQMKDEKYLENPIIAPLMAALDKRHLTDFGIKDERISVDLAADNAHPGAQTQIIYASRLFDFFEKNIASRASQIGSLTADTVS